MLAVKRADAPEWLPLGVVCARLEVARLLAFPAQSATEVLDAAVPAFMTDPAVPDDQVGGCSRIGGGGSGGA
ncbi:hypothetical protein Mro03_72650 [Microbispora rosea subsp. rosea]|nr:hypothetical protein Mro03_72650 [Microbispora rosea subsp. rosea]